MIGKNKIEVAGFLSLKKLLTKLFVAGKTRIGNHHDASIENKYAFEVYSSILFIFASKIKRTLISCVV